MVPEATVETLVVNNTPTLNAILLYNLGLLHHQTAVIVEFSPSNKPHFQLPGWDFKPCRIEKTVAHKYAMHKSQVLHSEYVTMNKNCSDSVRRERDS